MTKVSIIVPIYNVACYLDECLSSLCHQIYQNLEIILVNDGSTDKSKQICETFLNNDKRIILINQENMGHGPALNRGLHSVHGKYVMFCDGDDYYFPNMVGHLIEAIQKTRSEVATCSAYAFDNNSKLVSLDPGHSLIRVPRYTVEDCLDKNQIISDASLLTVQYWAKIYETNWLRNNQIYFPQEKISYDDIPFHWHVLSRVSKFAIVREQLYGYRLNRENASFSHINQAEYFRSYQIAAALLQQNEPRLIPSFILACINDLYWLGDHVEMEPLIIRDIKYWLQSLIQSTTLTPEIQLKCRQFSEKDTVKKWIKRYSKKLLCH
jgi:glycosyltransferase involved in cell wall biosynthesis